MVFRSLANSLTLPDFGVATKDKNFHIELICYAFYFSMLLDLEQKTHFWTGNNSS